MSVRRLIPAIFGMAAFALSGCDSAPGRPAAGSAQIAPDEVSDFESLYSENCAGCHGTNGKGGAALALGDPVYLGIVDDARLKRVSTNGIPGTSMAAFAQSAGGMLTEKQIDIIVSGIRSRWAKPDILRGANPPPYSSSEAGNPARGADVYAVYCSSCHGPGGKGGPKASSVVDGSFLALLDDQELRTLVIVGRPELGAPDWRDNLPGKPMSSQEISDVVAWLAAQRAKFPGQPYPSAAKPTGEIR
jgi:cytochrome c oxidase cbb3-type subunit 3